MTSTVSPAAHTASCIETYENVCRATGIKADPQLIALLREHSPSARLFSTRRLPFSDRQALALCSGLLRQHGATCTVVRSYVAATCSFVGRVWNGVPSLRGTLQQNETSAGKGNPSPAPKWLLLDFSANDQLTAHGAASIVAASMLLPVHCNVELALHANWQVTSLPLRPWEGLLSNETSMRRARGAPLSALVGLHLDSCRLRSLEISTLQALRDLRWLSVRYTCIANLERAAEIASLPPRLIGVLVASTRFEDRDAHQLRQLRLACHRELTAGTQVSDTDLRKLLHSPVFRAKNDTEEILKHKLRFQSGLNWTLIASTANAVVGGLPGAPALSPTQRQLLVRDVMRIISSPAPVTSLPRYFEYVVSRARGSLKILDGQTLLPTRRMEARRLCQGRFDDLDRGGVESLVSLESMFRRREQGLSFRRVYKVRPRNCTPDNSHEKRVRTPDTLPKSIDMQAVVIAAGFPAPKRPRKLGVAAEMQVALAAASTIPQGGTSDAKALLQKAQRTAPEGQRHVTQVQPLCTAADIASIVPDEEGPGGLASSLRVELEPFREDAFETHISSVLVRRPGVGKIEYLDTECDRPRQFEYNPGNPSELVYGTESDQLVVIDHRTGRVKASCTSGGGLGMRKYGEVIPLRSNLNSVPRLSCAAQVRYFVASPVYGLSWLNKNSGKFLSGTNQGHIHVYDVNRMMTRRNVGCAKRCHGFADLTSIHGNCDDTTFAASGKQLHVGLYDLATGTLTELMRGCHAEEINVIKFAHHSPHVLVTSSFDRFVKKWDLRESRPGGGRRPVFESRSSTDTVMACFSPDDSRLLVSATDNEVRQIHASDGRLEHEFRIPKTGSLHNYTRSYYMNGRDYMITGSSMESTVRIYNTQTGALFKQVDMDNRQETAQKYKVNVQSLRADPGQKFAFSVLLAPTGPRCQPGLLAKVDLRAR